MIKHHVVLRCESVACTEREEFPPGTSQDDLEHWMKAEGWVAFSFGRRCAKCAAAGQRRAA